MGDDLGPDLDQLLPDRGQRPVLYFLGQRQGTHEVGEVVRRSVKLEPNRVILELSARQPGPLDSVFALLDPLLSRVPVIVEDDDPFGGRLRLVTMKPTRGYSSPECHLTFATTRRFLSHDPA